MAGCEYVRDFQDRRIASFGFGIRLFSDLQRTGSEPRCREPKRLFLAPIHPPIRRRGSGDGPGPDSESTVTWEAGTARSELEGGSRGGLMEPLNPARLALVSPYELKWREHLPDTP